MNKLYRPILCGALLIIAGHSLFAQAPPPLTCTGGKPTMAGANASGSFAPLDPTPIISALSPEPRFR